MSTIVIDNNEFEEDILEASLESGYTDVSSIFGKVDPVQTNNTLYLTINISRDRGRIWNLLNNLMNYRGTSNTIKNDNKLNKKYNTIKFYKE